MVSLDALRRHGGALVVFLTTAFYGGSLMLSRWWYQASADSNYHFAVAREIARGNLTSERSPHLPWTVLSDMAVDHYFGYHALLAPFAWIPDPVLGMKLSTLLFFCAVPLSVYWFLKSRAVPLAWVWALTPLLLSNQDWRYLMLRGGHLIVPLSFAFLHFAFFASTQRRRRWGIVFVAWLAMLCYHGALVLLPLHVAGLLSLGLLRRDLLEKGQGWEVLLTLVGFALALTLNPYMDASASTWRFLWYHVGYMNFDPADLYPGLREFGPVPFYLLVQNPIFWIFPLVVVVVAARVISRRVAGARPTHAQAVLLGAALVGLVLAARAIRMREYAVPWALCFLATMTPAVPAKWPMLRKLAPAIAGALACCVLLLKWPDTFAALGKHLPTDQFSGARPLLEETAGRPVLNIAEGDYTTLRFEYPDVVAVQGLSRYFLYPNKPVFDDVWELRRTNDPTRRLQILQRFYDRGVRLLAVQHRNPVFDYAEQHPEVLQLAYRASYKRPTAALEGSSIYRLDPSAWGAAERPLSPRDVTVYDGASRGP